MSGEKLGLRGSLTNPFRRSHKTPQETMPPSEKDFKPPPGPPPGYAQPSRSSEVFAPPPGPPPSAGMATSNNADTQPPGYADWMAVPDTSQLPPPPSIAYEESPTANATALSADEAQAWCLAHCLDRPRHLLSHETLRLSRYDINFAPPQRSFFGNSQQSALGTWRIRTTTSCNDTIRITDLPLYSALEDNVNITSRLKTIYFEIKVIRMGGFGWSGEEADGGIAIGFVATPYPHWRLPGWERASLGVHGDDGRRYVHNNLGGQDFTTSFKDGEVVGIGMTFSPPGGVEVFFTREGERAGSWNLHEERDRDDGGGGVEGLEGGSDLYAAIGMFGGVDFETRFRRDQWLYRPQS